MRNRHKFKNYLLTLFRMEAGWWGHGGGGGSPPTTFYPVTSTNVGIRPQNFMTFSFKTFDRLV